MEALRLRLAAGPTGAFGLAGSRGVAEIARVRWRQEDSAPGRSDSSNDPSHEILPLISGNITAIGMPRAPSASIRRGSAHWADVLRLLLGAVATRVP